MVKAVGKIALLSMFASVAIYAVNLGACQGCHGANFENKAMGKSKIVKDMSKDNIIKALKGYKDGSYGGAMKGVMKSQVASLSDADISAIADSIKGGGGGAKAPAKAEAPKAEAPAKKGVVDINKGVDDPKLLDKEDLGNKKVVDENDLGYRKQGLDGAMETPKADFNRPAPGTSQRFARSYVNAPPLIPHSVEGLLPITASNNACLGCHMPDKAKAVGAIPIPVSHFTDFRPLTKLDKDGKVIKDGKAIVNTSDVKIAKFKKLKKLNPARYNCSQCHVPQANIKPLVGNTFKPEFGSKDLMEKSNLIDVIGDGVK
jgi:cytochrome c-type protein NapB